ncbi:hypothetical protein DLAC_02522 [Tieghemostelium lacteum]|uniref:Cytochrome P450 family protein n=1 Tax=Tieghemostelium lacteum TaxID=361077 RepID=A0A152A390_TIELA|nr:hypothetical protein DLAC_02522 [Tieghemostelium lacteum]|eukprot:KYR00511.1 hypothetical protein DLAC_02522 [Tieghemostelium lacteum]
MHLLSSKKLPHEVLNGLSSKYGMVYRFYMGSYYSLVVTDPDMMREIFIKNFDNFTDRLHIPSIKYASNNFRGIGSADEYQWRVNKQRVISAFSGTNIKKVSHLLEKTTSELVSIMSEFEASGREMEPIMYFRKYATNVICRYIFSLEVPYGDEEMGVDGGRVTQLIKAVHDISILLGSGSKGDFISVLSPFYDIYLTYFTKEITNINQFVREIVMEHLNTLDKENPKDLIDTLIMQFDCTKPENIQEIVYIARDIFMSVETPANTLEWFTLLMANYPIVQEKVYQELKMIVSERDNIQLTLKDRNSTPYLNATIKESMRYKNIAPLGGSRVAKNDIVINNIFIPKGCNIIQNFYGLSRNEQFWNEPNQFLPDRFINNNHSDLFYPFALGPRNCLGQNLALDELYLACSNILVNFKISPPEGSSKLDETEIFSLSAHPHKFKIKLEKRV